MMSQKQVSALLHQAQEERLHGQVTFIFREGKIKLIKVLKTSLPPEFDLEEKLKPYQLVKREERDEQQRSR
jgi:hypothetical protein